MRGMTTYAWMKKPLSIFLFLIFFFCISTDVLSQERIGIEEWLDKRRQSMISGSLEIDQNTFNPSWIRELEFRTETEDFLIDKQEYLIRYRPSLPNERRAQSKLIEVSREEWGINRLNYENDLNRYLLDEFLVIRQINEEIKLLRELTQIYQDQRLLIRDQIYEGKFNIKDLHQIDNDLRRIESKIAEYQLRLDLFQQYEILPDTDQLVSIEEISSQLKEQDLSGLPSVDQIERSFDLRKTAAEIELEKVEGGRIFDFVQLRYNGPHSDLLSERLALGVNIQFPGNSRSKLRMEELRVEQLIRQQEYDLEQQLDSIRLTRELDEFTILLRKWDYNQKVINQNSNELNDLLNKGINLAYENPDVILYQKESLIKLKQEQLELEEKIYNLFLDLLERTIILGENKFQSFIIRN